MVAGSIHLCGAFGGLMSGPNKNNAKGMFENAYIRENVCKPYLRSIGVDALGQFPLPDVTKIPIPNDWRSRVEQVMISQGYKSGPWMYKGAKCCLMWPVWHYAFPDAKWVIVRRRTADIVRSCQKTGFMRAFRNRQYQLAVGAKDEAEGWLWWVHQHEKRFVEMINEGLNVKIIWPERVVQGDYQQMYELLGWLNLSWKSEVLGFVDPKLWKARMASVSEITVIDKRVPEAESMSEVAVDGK